MRVVTCVFIITVILHSCSTDNINNPDNGGESTIYQIIFTSKDNIYYQYIFIMNTLDLKVDTLISIEKEISSPRFINSERIMFVAGSDLYFSDINGNYYNITDTPDEYIYNYSVDESETKILYAKVVSDGNEWKKEIFCHDIQSDTVYQLTHSLICSGAPCISPDGDCYCYITSDNLDGTRNSLIVRDFNNTINDTINDCEPGAGYTISPDNRFVSYSSLIGRLYLYDIEEKTSHFLNDDGINPRFSPDGKKIYFRAQYPTEYDYDYIIACINVNGTGLKYFNSLGATSRYDISSDGEQLIFYNHRFRALCLVDVSSNELQVLIEGDYPSFRPSEYTNY